MVWLLCQCLRWQSSIPRRPPVGRCQVRSDALITQSDALSVLVIKTDSSRAAVLTRRPWCGREEDTGRGELDIIGTGTGSHAVDLAGQPSTADAAPEVLILAPALGRTPGLSPYPALRLKKQIAAEDRAPSPLIAAIQAVLSRCVDQRETDSSGGPAEVSACAAGISGQQADMPAFMRTAATATSGALMPATAAVQVFKAHCAAAGKAVSRASAKTASAAAIAADSARGQSAYRACCSFQICMLFSHCMPLRGSR